MIFLKKTLDVQFLEQFFLTCQIRDYVESPDLTQSREYRYQSIKVHNSKKSIYEPNNYISISLFLAPRMTS